MPESSSFHLDLKRFSCQIQAVINQFAGVQLLAQQCCPLDAVGMGETSLAFGNSLWRCSLSITDVDQRDGTYDLIIHFTLIEGQADEVNVGLQFVFEDWNAANYVLMPAAVYNGNRFESRRIPYPPILTNPADIGPQIPTIISDVPRLNIHPGPSRIQQITRDMATPAVGFQAPHAGQGFLLLTDQATRLGDSGLDIEESDDRSRAVIQLAAPGVRLNERYTIADMHHPCDDRGAGFQPGDWVEIRARLIFFACPRIQDLFDRFFEVRKDLAGELRLPPEIPFASAWKIQEEKYNLFNWDEPSGYYAVGIRDQFLYSHWQVGWVGGLMSTYPMLVEGSSLSRSRALRTFDFVFPAGQDESGFLHGCGKEGRWFGDNFRDTSKKWLLIRKNSDALYFVIKQFMLLHKQEPHGQLPAHWHSGARRLADAFVRLWDRCGQFGQFVDTATGDIIVGGSTSAAIAPAGLALAWQYFGNQDYLRVAAAAGQFFYQQFVQKGYTTGGPGEILQCPDSESAFGLLESFVVLYEVTGETHWLDKAREQAHQCSSWCVSYDFAFPPDSTFGKLGMCTAGSVYANVQNKHGAPGICTLSGDMLFKLFRATADRRYLDLIQEIAHNLPQYLSRQDRPIIGMPPGWMGERVEMSDWLEPIGEIFYGSCWPEVSTMLTYVEVPGLYVQTDTGLVCAIDHIQVDAVEQTEGRMKLYLTNPTAFPAKVRVLAETSAQAAIPLGQNGLWNCQQVSLGPGESVILELVEERPL